mmetsp:Transcript_12459/g.56171  ORF Transcript_12459/g.56171 Transcript_12459/m.56171 type:complete len:261 (-) Transcript_12459:319-1101(-)
MRGRGAPRVHRAARARPDDASTAAADGGHQGDRGGRPRGFLPRLARVAPRLVLGQPRPDREPQGDRLGAGPHGGGQGDARRGPRVEAHRRDAAPPRPRRRRRVLGRALSMGGRETRSSVPLVQAVDRPGRRDDADHPAAIGRWVRRGRRRRRRRRRVRRRFMSPRGASRAASAAQGDAGGVVRQRRSLWISRRGRVRRGEGDVRGRGRERAGQGGRAVRATRAARAAGGGERVARVRAAEVGVPVAGRRRGVPLRRRVRR